MLPRRKNIRLPYYDYHTNGMYFITICTKKKQHVFGKISDGKIVLNPLGQYARKRLQAINNSYPDVQVIHAIVMPNHVHAIFSLENDTAPALGQIVNRFKGSVSRQFGKSLWQRSYYEHVIRNKQDLLKTMEYIENNPLNWQLRHQLEK